MTTEHQRGGVGELRECFGVYDSAGNRQHFHSTRSGAELFASRTDEIVRFVEAAPSPPPNQTASPVKVESGEAELILSHLELWRNRAATSRKWERGTEVDLLSNLLDKLEAALSPRRPDTGVPSKAGSSGESQCTPAIDSGRAAEVKPST